VPSVLIVGGNYQYVRMFEDNGWEVVDAIKDADLVQFTGGADVDPSLYGHKKHPTTMTDSACDARDATYYEQAKRLNKKMAGICRGAQFLNVCNGGVMVQDCNGHAVGLGHKLVDRETGFEVHVSSTHHQMMVPADDAIVVAHANEATIKECNEAGTIVNIQGEMEDDMEVLYYDYTKCLCFQPHPEFTQFPSCTKYYFQCLERWLQLK
jgi:gamma-glutamyl-gamma-aminobutyrate hydrolase PuuD